MLQSLGGVKVVVRCPRFDSMARLAGSCRDAVGAGGTNVSVVEGGTSL